MAKQINGLHHVTATSSDAQQNVDFYAGILGLRMVKKTINFDAPDVYHLYYGNEEGNPGTIMTFFPYPGLIKGRKGKGQLTVTSFSIPENSLEYWMKRLEQFNILYRKPEERFDNEGIIYFEDGDGLGIELVANKTDKRKGFSYGQIPEEHSVKGFYGVTLSEDSLDKTSRLLVDEMDHHLVGEKNNRYRFSVSDQPGDFVDVVTSSNEGRALNGSGTVHHLAFATDNDATQLNFREKVLSKGVQATPVLDRQYFHSIYFREPGGVLFEVATSDIGFAIDEAKEHLGEALKLPKWEEANRPSIEKGLTEIVFDYKKFM